MKSARKSVGVVLARALGVAAIAAAALITVGCNTVKGAGQDLQESSENVERAIQGSSNN